MSRRASFLLAFAFVGCARTSGSESEMPNLIADEDIDELSRDVKHRTLQMFYAALSQAEYTHHDHRREPCAVASRHLEALIAANHRAQAESAELFRICGCCLESPDEADEADEADESASAPR